MCRELGGDPSLTALEKMTKILEAKPVEKPTVEELYPLREEPPAPLPGGFIPSASLTRKPDSAKEVLLIVVDVDTSSVLSCETVGDGTFGAVLHSLVKRRPDLLEKAEGQHLNPGYICYKVCGGRDFIDGICLAMNLMTREDIDALRDLLATHPSACLNFYGSF